RTLGPRGVAAEADGVKVQVAVDLPPPPPAIPVPEAPLTPEELQRWQATLESWDAFLVFVVKDLGLSGQDPAVRNELLDLLLTSRYELLAALAGEPQPGVDPVRQLFLHAWDRLHDVVRRAALRGGLEGRALRYATFLAAGDARAAVDRLLDLVPADARQRNTLDARVADTFPHLVKAVAWQESCWRQFVRQSGKVTYLLSSTGDIGLMQVNRRVWRGFFDVRRLQ